MNVRETIEQIKSISLFYDFAMEEEKLKLVASIMEKRSYVKSEYIFREKEPGNELFILISGSITVLKTTRSGDEYTIVDLYANSEVFFGEFALMDHDLRSASIRVLQDCSVLVMNREKFEALGNQRPDIALPILRVISKKMSSYLRNSSADIVLLFDALVNEIEEAEL